MAACSGGARAPTAGPTVNVAPPAPASASPAAASAAPEAPKPPRGYIEMQVAGIEPNDGGAAIVLENEARQATLRIYVGGTEALSIALRYNHRHYARPLTHDLLDNVIRELGAELVKVQVDDLKDNTFIGSIFLRRANKIIRIDARPSDAIALALGNEVPIYVSEQVVSKATPEPRSTMMP